MKNKIAIVFTLCIIAATAYAQTAKELSQKADSLYLAKNYTQAAHYYLRLSHKVDFKIIRRGCYYQAACCYALYGNSDSAILLLQLAIQNGFRDADHIKGDGDLTSLHTLPVWDTLVGIVERSSASTNDPYKVKLITTDVKNFWNAYDMVKKHPAQRMAIYKKYYLDAGTDGLQDYFAYKIGSIKDFVDIHDCKPRFYAAIRKNTLAVDQQKLQMIGYFVQLKQLYPAASFPDIYFVMGCFLSAGTSTDDGLLIGVDQVVATPDIPVDELSLWQRNNFTHLSDLPSLVTHELVHFNQEEMDATDTTLLRAVLVEGMADFIAELITGQNPNKRLFVWAKGKEKKIWASFEKEMYLNRADNWIANSGQETADKPADLGYWIGYQVCKAYYDRSIDKNKAISDMLHIQDYKDFYSKSGVALLFK